MPSDSEPSSPSLGDRIEHQPQRQRQKPKQDVKPEQKHHKRPTHFLCLPLTTPDSVPQLAKSLATFRNITTAPPKQSQDSEDPQSPQADRGESPLEGNDANQNQSSIDTKLNNDSSTQEDSLRIIPSAAHRAPGTFHLTLGVMDLSDREVMRNTIKCLKEGDWRGLLKDIEIGIQTGMNNPQRKSLEVEKQDKQATAQGSEVTNESKPVYSIPSDINENKEDHGTNNTRQHSPRPKPNTNTDTTLSSLKTRISPPPSSRSSLPPPTPTTTTTTLPSQSNPITIILHSLLTFPHPHSSRVFYASPYDRSSRLQPLANKIRDHFSSQDLLLPEPGDRRGKDVVLHATVANLIYVKPENDKKRGGRGGKWARRKRGKPMRVDARGVIGFFGVGGEGERLGISGTQRGGRTEGERVEEDERLGFVWARDVVVDRLRICKMGAVKSQDQMWGMEYHPIKDPDGDGVAEVVF